MLIMSCLCRIKTLTADDLFAPFAGPVEDDGLEVDPISDDPIILAGKLCNFDIFAIDDKGKNILIPKKSVILTERKIHPMLQKR